MRRTQSEANRRMWLRSAVLSATAVAVVSLLPQLSAAHDNVIVHRKLGEWSVTSLNNPFYSPYINEVKEGSFGEDVPATRSLGHFYNPQTNSAPWFAIGSGPAWQNSQDQYNAGINEYLAGNYTGEDAAFFRMGRALHFIQDMTSPAHTHDDQHGTDDEDFEDWGPANVNSFDFSAVTPKIAANPTAEGFVKEISRLAYDMTAYQADIDENTGPQPSSEFKSMFSSLHWVDGGFFGDDVWEVDRIGSFDCFGNGIFCNDGWWMLSETLIENNSGRGGSRRLRGNAYIENTGGNGGPVIPAIFKGQANPSNETLLHIYGRLLYPEAVAYGAGLLGVFAEAVGAPATPTLTAAASTATPTQTTDPAVPTSTPTSPPTPTPSLTPTLSPAPPTATPSPTATPGPLCGITPRGCRLPGERKSGVALVDKSDDSRDSFSWKWSRGDVLPSDLGVPVLDTNYAVCVYDEVADIPALRLAFTAAAGSKCSGVNCWSSVNGGYKYKDRYGSAGGLTALSIKSSATLGRGKIAVKAKGTAIVMPAPFTPNQLLAQDGRVRVQLVNDIGVCWEGVFSNPARRNDAQMFKTMSD